MKGGFLGTVAPPYAHLTLLLEIARAPPAFPAACVVPVGDRATQPCRDRSRDDAFVSSSGGSGDTAKTCQDILCSGDGTRGARNEYRNRGIVHLACRGHGRLAGEIPHHQIQGLDANRISTLVVRALVGIGNLRPLVRPAFLSEMKSRGLRSRASS